jgi:hypothetical protein
LQRRYVSILKARFDVARMSRALRRGLLAILEGLDPDSLVEDMLRHRSYWVWVGEFLHPHEYAKRYPNVARGFEVVRKSAPDGTRAPKFETWAARLERALADADTGAVLALLGQRPGELARRFDHALRTAPDEAARRQALELFASHAERFSTPVLLTLWSFLPTRTRPAAVRVFWPKGAVAKGVAAPDRRPPLDESVVAEGVRVVEAELLRRFAEKPRFDAAIVDESLRAIVAPFNERTATSAAIALPRGSRVRIPDGKVLRLFMHWCEPERSAYRTDLDLSVAFYDDQWNYVGVCSYYQLEAAHLGKRIAASSGDFTSAPFPAGASEFVDVHLDEARAASVRYVVAVVNAYAGMPFSMLERAFAGVMLRDDVEGLHFDPRTVELRFSLQGESGVYMPLVADISERTLHWLDVHSKGRLVMNDVESSRHAIATVCPNLMTYFASGVRTSMYDLALLHAAARTRHVHVRSDEPDTPAGLFARLDQEDAAAFLSRIRGGDGRETAPPPGRDGPPVLAALHDGDLVLPAHSQAYALFPETTDARLAASDFIS